MKRSCVDNPTGKSVVFCILIVAIVASVACASETNSGKKSNELSRKDEMLITITGTVKAIDYQERQLRLEDQAGKMIIFTADPSIKRFNEVQIGDVVTTDYYMSIAGELRSPTAEEVENPFVVIEGADRSASDSLPAGVNARMIRAVCTVEALDRTAETVTLKGPHGNFLVVRVKDPSRLTQGRIGDTVVVTYTEALAIRLDRNK